MQALFLRQTLERKVSALALSMLMVSGLCACSENVLLAIPRRSPEAERQMNQEVRFAMQRIQVGAEHYAADHNSVDYPTKIDDEFKSYMPGGEEGVRPAPVGVVNVFTGKNAFPKLGSIKDVHAARHGERFPASPGEVTYCPLEGGKGYAIYGGAADGKALPDEKNPGEVLILSNIDD